MTAFAGVPCRVCGWPPDTSVHKPAVINGIFSPATHAYAPDEQSLEFVACELAAALDGVLPMARRGATWGEYLPKDHRTFPARIAAAEKAREAARALGIIPACPAGEVTVEVEG